MPTDELFRQVEKHARAALAVSDNIESAHIALAYKYFYYDCDWDEAQLAFRRAVDINSSCVWAHIGLSQIMTATGDVQQGILSMKRAVDLDPVSPIAATMLGCAYYFAGEYETAETVLADCIALHNGFPIALASMSWVKVITGEARTAVPIAREACERSADSPLMNASYCYALASAGEMRKARSVLAKLKNTSSARVPDYWLAICHLALGEGDSALELLEDCMKTRCAWRVLMLVDPKVQPLANHPRFRTMLHQLRFPGAASAR
jgi:serine/threonine-protein kinase